MMGFLINRHQIGTVHTEWDPGLWTKDRVFRTQKFIGSEKDHVAVEKAFGTG